MTLFCSYCLLKLGKMRTQLYMYRAVQVQIFLLFYLIRCFILSLLAAYFEGFLKILIVQRKNHPRVFTT